MQIFKENFRENDFMTFKSPSSLRRVVTLRMHFKKRQTCAVETAEMLSLVPITKKGGSKDPHPLKSTLVRVGQLRSQCAIPVGWGLRRQRF